jgi:hypothetical protein
MAPLDFPLKIYILVYPLQQLMSVARRFLQSSRSGIPFDASITRKTLSPPLLFSSLGSSWYTPLAVLLSLRNRGDSVHKFNKCFFTILKYGVL